jgi:hypothetical protein
MTKWAEDYDYVIGGDPDRDTIDLAVLDTATGGIRPHRGSGRRSRIRSHARLGTTARLAAASGRWGEQEVSPLAWPGNLPWPVRMSSKSAP